MFRTIVSLIVVIGMVGSFALDVSAKPKKDKGKTLNFEGDTVKTQQIEPEVLLVDPGRKPGKHKSLVKPRSEFDKETLRSADQL
jgi:hypothetical protein